MSAWLGFWWVVITVAFLCYTGVAILVSIRAFGDVKELFRYLTQEHKVEAENA